MLIVNKKHWFINHHPLARSLTSFLRGRQSFLLTLPGEET
jgi:hypothetical protein